MARKATIPYYTALLLLLPNLAIALTPSEAQQIEWQKPRPFLGPQPTLVLMVDFSDIKFRLSMSQVEQIVKTVDNFIRGSSYGKTWLEYYIHPKVITLPKPMNYYGGPSPGAQRGDNDERLNEYHWTVIKYAKERERIDLTRFKHVIVVHAGGDEAVSHNPNDIWSHCFPSKGLQILIEQFGFDAVESELRRRGYDWYVDIFMHRRPDGSGHLLSGIETVAEADRPSVMMHEFTHSMWISDHYVYAKDGYSGGSEVGVWTNMDYGSHLDPPVDIDGWSKYILGWIETIEVKGSGEYTIHTLDKKDEPHGLIIPIDDEEYYFIHARRPRGQDAALPGPGVLLFRINKYVRNNVEGEPFFIRLFDANPNTPPECSNFPKEAIRLCEGFDAPFYSDRGYRGSYSFRLGRFAINLLTSEFTSDEGWVFKVVDFDESAGVARISINLGGSQSPTTTQTETRTETATTHVETRTVTRTVTGTVIQTVYTTQTVIGETTTTVIVTVTTAPPPRQTDFTDYISIAVVLAGLLAAMALIITRRGRGKPFPPPPPPPPYR